MAIADIEALRRTLAEGLPGAARWPVGDTSVRFDFARLRSPLRPVAPEDVSGSLEDGWGELLVFGEEDVAEGGGARPFIAIHARSGEVLGLDFEREEPLFFYSSDVARYVRTFELFDAALRTGAVPLGELASRARAIDPNGYARSDWRELAEHFTPS